MENLRLKMKSNPLAAALCVLLVSFVGDKLLAIAFSQLPDQLFFNTIYQFVCILWPLALVMLCGYGRVYRQTGILRTLSVSVIHLLLFGLILFGIVAANLLQPDTPWVSAPEIAYGVLFLFVVGFSEESIYRGIVVNLLAEKGMRTHRDILRVAFISGLLFGAMHMTNVFSGVTLRSALFQSISAFSGGLILCAYYLRGGSLWGVILIHGFQDSVGLFDSLFIEGGTLSASLNEIGSSALFVSAIFTLAALFLLRKSKTEKIIALHEKAFPAGE